MDQDKSQKVILFVEDEEALQKIFGDVLSQEGYKVIPAIDGEVGLEMAKTQKPDIILLDLVMPKKDGFEVLKELKDDEKTASIPVIVLTNLESAAHVEKAISMGATTYLVKGNYRLDEVVVKVRDALEGYKIVSALDGETGLEMAKGQGADLILLDLILPKKDGFSVLEELKGNPQTKDIPVIVLSNLESSSDVERAISMGANTYLVKANYKLDEVVAKIRDVLE
jgi:DNA-binding response OmpR family regulator